MPAPTGLKVTVKRFELIGNTLLSEAELRQTLASYLNRPLGYVDLQSAAAAVAEAYRKRGWVVRTLLPGQVLEHGIVKIQIVEATLGQVRVPPDTDLQRFDRELAQDRLRASQQPGQPLNIQAIERALQLLDDLPGVRAQGRLTAGQGEQETDLVLNLSDTPLVSGQIRLDNTGSRFTGATQLNAALTFSSPTRVGDAINLGLLHSRGSDYLNFAYARPLGLSGWGMQLSATGLQYTIVESAFSSIQLTGSAYTQALGISYPLIRSQKTTLLATLNGERKRYQNLSGAAVSSQSGISNLSFLLNGSHADELGNGGILSGSLSLTAGRLNPSDTSASDAALSAGRFNKLTYALARQQSLGGPFSLTASWRGQWADKNLNSAEKLYLGGAGGVRAYPGSEAGGSLGQMLNLELVTRLADQFSLSGFYDWGHIQVNADNAYTGAPLLNSYALKGAGLSLMWSNGQDMYARLVWAHRIGDNPNPTLTGTDQDGTLVKNRFWLTASLNF